MALQQLDSNMRTPNQSIHSRESASGDLSYNHKKDEKFGAKTPPSDRILAPTQSSAAKVTSSNLRNGKPLPRSPTFASVASPDLRQTQNASTIPATVPKWSDRVVRRMQSRDKVDKASPASTASMSSTDAPMPPLPIVAEKPLPSRPIASLTTSLSPSKDTRTLIDAIEKPLIVSSGSQLEWPALTPRSVSAPERKSQSISQDIKGTPSAIPRKVLSSTSMARSSIEVVKMLERRTPRNSNASGLTQHSSDPSFVSAEEPYGEEQGIEGGSASLPSLVAFTGSDFAKAQASPHTPSSTTFPVRMQSLGNRFPSGAITQPKRSSKAGVINHRTKGATQDTPLALSRGHSPSPASFSRPRPGSGIHVSRLPSLSKDTPSTAEKVLHPRTASRIPIPDSKKATLVDIRNIPPLNDNELSPSFGARRLISPTALAILDQGTKRRLQRANTSGSIASTTSSSTRILNIGLEHDEQQDCRSKNSSPADTFGPSSSDEEEIPTPVVQPYALRNGVGAKPQQTLNVDDLSMVPSDLNFRRLRTAPPSKSPFTGPLQTIHSQASLAMPRHEESSPLNGLPSKPNPLSRRMNDLRAGCSNVIKKHHRNQSVDQDDSSKVLKQLLEDSELGNELHQQVENQGPQNENNSHHDQTLSLLEGHGSPSEEAFDHGKLEQMFGQQIPGVDQTSKTNTFLNDATTAAKFVEGQSHDSGTGNQLTESEHDDELDNVEDLGNTAAELPANETCQTPAVSKWSDSTPSAQGNSSELQRKEQQRSIGYPSTSHGTSMRISAHLRPGSRPESGFDSRNSSPTLGRTKRVRRSMTTHGSVMRGRLAAIELKTERNAPASDYEIPVAEHSGFARMTASASSKKIPRAAGSGKGARKQDITPRGRDSFPGISRTASVSIVALSKPPRSRSKSRTVLDKINGFFLHKREKKAGELDAPPLPAIDFSKVTGHPATHLQSPNSLPPQLPRATQTTSPPVTTLPEALSPLSQEQRSCSRATNASDKSFASNLPLDGDCDGKVVTLVEKLINKSKQERSSKRKQRLLNFAYILGDAITNVREAQISAEKAKAMAEQAELSYMKTQKGVEMLSRLASSLVQSTVRR